MMNKIGEKEYLNNESFSAKRAIITHEILWNNAEISICQFSSSTLNRTTVIHFSLSFSLSFFSLFELFLKKINAFIVQMTFCHPIKSKQILKSEIIVKVHFFEEKNLKNKSAIHLYS